MVPVFSTALVGLVIGFLGKGMMPSSDKGGVITTACLGICGGNLAASIGWLNGLWEVGSPTGYGAAVVGAVLLLIVYRIFAGLKIEA